LTFHSPPSAPSSECFFDLDRELSEQDFKEADLLTDALMVRAVGRKGTDWVRHEELTSIPCETLRRIDALWLRHSSGRFGFTVQTAIWQSLNGVGLHTVGDGDMERAFGKRVGWRVDDDWIGYERYTFDVSAPLGHLPRHYCRHSSGWWVGRFSIIAAKLLECTGKGALYAPCRVPKLIISVMAWGFLNST
jgi:hypothetical protein